MDLSSSMVSSPCMNNEADQSMKEVLTSEGSAVKGTQAKICEADKREKKRLVDRKYRQEKRRAFERMTEEIERLKESITQMQSNQQLSAPILEKLESYFSQSTSQQHDVKGVSVQIEYLQDIRQLGMENRQLKEETRLLSTENRQLKEEYGQLSTKNMLLEEEIGLLRVENRSLKEENSQLKLETEHLADVIKGLHGKSQILEVPQRQDSRISQPTCQVDQNVYVQNNRCTENFGNKEAVVGMELERMTSKNSFLKSEFCRLTDEIRRLQEDITWLRPNWLFPDQDLNKLGDHFFQSTSQQHDDYDKSASVQSCGFQLLEGIQDVQKTGSSDMATNQNHI